MQVSIGADMMHYAINTCPKASDIAYYWPNVSGYAGLARIFSLLLPEVLISYSVVSRVAASGR